MRAAVTSGVGRADELSFLAQRARLCVQLNFARFNTTPTNVLFFLPSLFFFLLPGRSPSPPPPTTNSYKSPLFLHSTWGAHSSPLPRCLFLIDRQPQTLSTCARVGRVLHMRWMRTSVRHIRTHNTCAYIYTYVCVCVCVYVIRAYIYNIVFSSESHTHGTTRYARSSGHANFSSVPQSLCGNKTYRKMCLKKKKKPGKKNVQGKYEFLTENSRISFLNISVHLVLVTVVLAL